LPSNGGEGKRGGGEKESLANAGSATEGKEKERGSEGGGKEKGGGGKGYRVRQKGRDCNFPGKGKKKKGKKKKKGGGREKGRRSFHIDGLSDSNERGEKKREGEKKGRKREGDPG